MSKLIKNSVALGVSNPLHQLVLKKLDPEDIIDRSKVDAGKHKFSFDLHIEGEMNISEDHWQVCWQKVRPMAMFAFALDKLNATSRQKVLEEAFDWYSKMTDEEKEKIEKNLEKDIKEVEEKKKKEAEAEKQKLKKELEEVKDVTKIAVEESKCWGIQKYNGRVSIKELKIEEK